METPKDINKKVHELVSKSEWVVGLKFTCHLNTSLDYEGWEKINTDTVFEVIKIIPGVSPNSWIINAKPIDITIPEEESLNFYTDSKVASKCFKA